MQVLKLCQKMGLVKLGHVALDGTKIKANASKHKATSYERMKEVEPQLVAEVERWLSQAESDDGAEDVKHGAERRGDELPEHIVRKQQRLEKIREAKAAIEAEAAAEAEARKPDKKDAREHNLGRQARELSADTGYCSEANLRELSRRHVRGYVATGRQRHGTGAPRAQLGKVPGTRTYAMRLRLARGGFRGRYRLRKQVVEPVFGPVRSAMGFTQFLLRGAQKVPCEWRLICTAHNSRKLLPVLARAAQVLSR